MRTKEKIVKRGNVIINGKNCPFVVPDPNLMKEVETLIQQAIVEEDGYYPTDDWRNLTPNLDLNIWTMGDERKATIYQVVNGQTDTSDGYEVADGYIGKNGKMRK